MIAIWLLVSVGVGVAVFLWDGCAAAFGWLVCSLFLFFLFAAIISC